MIRSHPRITARIPTEVYLKSTHTKGTITNISTDGVFLDGQFRDSKEMLGEKNILIKYNLQKLGNVEHSGKIIRKEKDGFAMKFDPLEDAMKTGIWEYITDNIVETNACPYCGEGYVVLPSVCQKCDWKLEFDSPGYFEYHEKTSLVKKLNSMADTLEPDQIRRLITFTNTDILKTGEREEFLQQFVATSGVMLDVFTNIRKVASTDMTVLILGESGTGKELTARAVHEKSARKDKPFVPINSAAIPENLLEAELFGYERGAFTGAYNTKKGKFELADGGTIFLDEIGDLSPALQAKLLRFLEDRMVERIGGRSAKKIDVRFIAATNCDIKSDIRDGRFRADLYYRLDAFTINLPPVRERGEDKIILARHFLECFSKEMGVSKMLSKEAVDAIMAHDWHGNVREVINKIRRAVLMAPGESVRPQDLGLVAPIYLEGETTLKNIRDTTEVQTVKETLASTGYNISKAARVLAISRPTLYSLIKKYSIQLPGAKKK